MANRFQRRRPTGAVCRQKELAPQPTARGKGRRRNAPYTAAPPVSRWWSRR